MKTTATATASINHFDGMDINTGSRAIFSKAAAGQSGRAVNKPALQIAVMPDFRASRLDKEAYVVVLRKGIQDFFLMPMAARTDGVKNVHYKEFTSKAAANRFIEKNIAAVR